MPNQTRVQRTVIRGRLTLNSPSGWGVTLPAPFGRVMVSASAIDVSWIVPGLWRRRIDRRDVSAVVSVHYNTDFVSATWAAIQIKSAEYPFLFHPSERLFTAAEQHGWPVDRLDVVDYMTLPGKLRR